jgi:hypothetical protein
MNKKNAPRGIDVSHLSLYNTLVLISSGGLFVFSVIMPAYDPCYVLIIFGGIVLSVSYFITAAVFYRQLFTAEPQRISMLTKKRNESKIFIYPYILDKRKISVYVSLISFYVSPNYKIVDVVFNGNSLNFEQDPNTPNKVNVKVNQSITVASKFAITLEDQSVDVTSRFLEFTLYYSKRDKSYIFKFKESHIID